MTKNKKMIAEFLRESKRIRRTLEFVSPTQETQSLLRHLDFIDETLEELGPKGKALTCLYRYHLSWENASQRLFISPNTLGRWRDAALTSLDNALTAAGIDIRVFDPYMGTPASKARLSAARRRADRLDRPAAQAVQ